MLEKLNCTLYGPWDDPSNWKLLPPQYTFNGNFFAANSNFFVRQFSTYEDCRKWVLTELKERRRDLGRNMELWLRRKGGTECSR